MAKKVTGMNARDGANHRSKGWIVFWLFGYPIGLVMFLVFSHLKL